MTMLQMPTRAPRPPLRQPPIAYLVTVPKQWQLVERFARWLLRVVERHSIKEPVIVQTLFS